MKTTRLLATSLVVASVLAAPADAQRTPGRDSMTISRQGTRAVQPGPEAQFTGSVRVEPLFAATDTARGTGALVTFEPGARMAWHTHPLGQTLIVTFGLGWVQREGGAVEEIRPGDVVVFAPNEKHWHGASPTTAMQHIAIQEALDGKAVDWLEHVTDTEYRAPDRGTAAP